MRFKIAAFVIASVLVLHAFALVFLYSTFTWFDMFMHFSGGFAMGLLGLAIWYASVQNIQSRAFVMPLFVLGFVAIIGIGWEWFEFLLDAVAHYGIDSLFRSRAFGVHQPDLSDTMSDFFFDLLGGAVSLLFARRK